MKSPPLPLIFLLLLGFCLFNVSPLLAAEVKVDGEVQVTSYLYDELEHFYGPPFKRSDYFLQQTRINTLVKAGYTTGVVQVYLDNLNSGNKSTGGYVWGSNGGYGSKISLDHVLRQAYLEGFFLVGTLSGGRKVIKLGHGIILNDTSDNISFNVVFKPFTLDLAYLKLKEPDSRNYGNPDDYDTNGYTGKLDLRFNETDMLEGFFAIVQQANPIGFITTEESALALGLAGSAKIGEIDFTAEGNQITGHDGNAAIDKPRWGVNLYMSGSTKLGFGKVGMDFLQIRGKRSNDEVSYNSFSGDFVGGHGILLNDQTRFGGGIDLNSGMVDMEDTTTAGYWHFISHNFTSIKAFFEMNPYKRWTVSFEFYPYVKVFDRGVLGLTNENIGMEGNLTAAYPLDENLKLTVGIAYLRAGDALQEIATVTNTPSFGKNIMKSQMSLRWNF